jgi:hypothetical protein
MALTRRKAVVLLTPVVLTAIFMMAITARALRRIAQVQRQCRRLGGQESPLLQQFRLTAGTLTG